MTAFDQYQKFLKALFEPTEVVCFAFFGKGLPPLHIFCSLEGALTQRAFDVLQEQNNKAYNVFVGMNPFKSELLGQSEGRTKENVARVKRLYADADKNGDAVLERIRTSGLTPPPNVTLNSSFGKYQFIWNVNGLTPETAESLLSAMAQEFQTDPSVAEIARVLRVPGFKNRKYLDAPEVTVVGDIDADAYDRVDFKVQSKSAVPEKQIAPRDSSNQIPHGYLHDALVQEAGALRGRGYTPEAIEQALVLWAEINCAPPVDFAHVREIARSSKNWEQGTPTGGDLLMTQQSQNQTARAAADWRSLFRSVGEMEQGDVVMVIDGVLQEGTCFIGANPASGKTLIGLAFAKAICTGEPLLGLPQYSVKEPRTVLYLIPESRDRAFRKRCEAFRIPDNDKFLSRTISAGVPLELGDPSLLEAVRQTKPIVFLDTASRFMKTGDENSAAQNRMLVNDVTSLLAAGAVCVIILHHATKAARDKRESMQLENMLRGTSDFGAMCDQAYGIRKDDALYANGSGPMEIDVVSLKDREQIGGLTSIRLAASYKKEGDTFVTSYINETGNFRVVSDSQSWARTLNRLILIVKAEPEIPKTELADRLEMSAYRVEQELKKLGWHRVQGGKGGASPWHQDIGVCPYKMEVAPTKDEKKTVKDAVAFLERLLEGTSPDGECIPEVEVYQEADKAGISDSLIMKARKRIGAIVGKAKEWSLPKPEPVEPEKTVGAF